MGLFIRPVVGLQNLIAICSYHSPLVARQPSLVAAIVDASVGQGDHAAGKPDVEHRRCGILQEFPGRGAELIRQYQDTPNLIAIL